MFPRAVTLAVLAPLLLLAQSPTLKQLMLDMVHPASNDILVTIARGGPANEADWASLRHNALTLLQSRDALMSQNAAPAWGQSVKLLSDAASDVYRAAQSHDTRALAAIPARLDASCTNCHRQFRPNVFPPPEGRVQ